MILAPSWLASSRRVIKSDFLQANGGNLFCCFSYENLGTCAVRDAGGEIINFIVRLLFVNENHCLAATCFPFSRGPNVFNLLVYVHPPPPEGKTHKRSRNWRKNLCHQAICVFVFALFFYSGKAWGKTTQDEEKLFPFFSVSAKGGKNVHWLFSSIRSQLYESRGLPKIGKIYSSVQLIFLSLETLFFASRNGSYAKVNSRMNSFQDFIAARITRRKWELMEYLHLFHW